MTKEDVLDLIRSLPEDVTLPEILAELEARRGEDRETDRTLLLKWFP